MTATPYIDAELRPLRAFAQDIMSSWPEGGLDGGDIQDLAVKHGLLAPVTVTEPCGENCCCAEYADFPQQCFRRTALLTGGIND